METSLENRIDRDNSYARRIRLRQMVGATTDLKRADQVLPNSLVTAGTDVIQDEYLSEIQIKRAALHPAASIKDEVVRSVRANAIGISLREYEQQLLDMGMEF